MFAQATTTQPNPIHFVWLPVIINTESRVALKSGYKKIPAGETTNTYGNLSRLLGEKLKDHGLEIFKWVDNPEVDYWEYERFLRHAIEDPPFAAREMMTAHGTDTAYIMRLNIIETYYPGRASYCKVRLDIENKFYHRRGDRIIDISQYILHRHLKLRYDTSMTYSENHCDETIDRFINGDGEVIPFILSITEEFRKMLTPQAVEGYEHNKRYILRRAWW